MLRRDFMPRSHYAALEQRESRFHRVCVYVAVGILPRVIYSLVKVLLHLVECPWIDGGFIRHNHFYVAPDVSIDNFAYCRGLRILSANHAEIAVALPDANYNRYVALWTPAAFLARNVGFINFDCAAELRRGDFQHRGADSMAQIPSCLVAHSERPLNLTGRHSLFGLAKQVCSEKPLLKRQVGIMEDSVHGHAELVLA